MTSSTAPPQVLFEFEAFRSTVSLKRTRGHRQRAIAIVDREEMRFAFPEKYLAARVIVDGVEVDVHNAHLPPVQAFEAIRRRMDADTGIARVLCGDFNAPVEEDADGSISRSGGPWSDFEQERWKLAEKRIVDSLDMRDVYRDVHERGLPLPFSHFTGHGDDAQATDTTTSLRRPKFVPRAALTCPNGSKATTSTVG